VRLSPDVTQRLAAKGIRLTKQREEVLGIMLQKRDHPTAAEVFLRAKRHMPSISLATVYNCLEALVQSGLVKQVNLDRAPTRYCANLLEHSHFFCEQCGSVFDVDIPPTAGLDLGPGFVVSHAEVALRGLCPRCSGDTRSSVSSYFGKTATLAKNADVSDIASATSERQTPNAERQTPSSYL
jgi:Fe2+ or Zn2+ uptake regulation protein